MLLWRILSQIASYLVTALTMRRLHGTEFDIRILINGVYFYLIADYWLQGYNEGD
jgi:hypothetical protein